MRKLQIGETISRTRKALGLTQEQLGSRLGVSAGAVSKWETGSALPDIALLAPLARALNISLDALLRYEQQLTGEEYAATIKKIEDTFIHHGAEEGRAVLYQALHDYPNNGGLKILGAKHLRMAVTAPGQQESALAEALTLYKDAETMDNGKHTQAALFGMADIYMLQGRYTESQACLTKLAEGGGFDAMLLYPRLLIEQERWTEAEAACKGQLLQYLNSAIAMVGQLAHIASQQGNTKQQLFYLEKQTLLEEAFDVGLYMGRLMLARFHLAQNEPQKAAEWYLAYVKGVIGYPLNYTGHPVFSGVQLQADEEAQQALRRTLLQDLHQNESYAPLHGQPEYRQAGELIEAYIQSLGR